MAWLCLHYRQCLVIFRHSNSTIRHKGFRLQLLQAKFTKSTNAVAILDLDKIIFRKDGTGITCANCGGDLSKIDKKSMLQWLIIIFSLGTQKTGHCQCGQCGRKYTVV